MFTTSTTFLFKLKPKKERYGLWPNLQENMPTLLKNLPFICTPQTRQWNVFRINLSKNLIKKKEIYSNDDSALYSTSNFITNYQALNWWIFDITFSSSPWFTVRVCERKLNVLLRWRNFPKLCQETNLFLS